MRVVFMGTPRLAAMVLEELVEHHEVVAVFTRPDAVRGRGKKLVASPVKETALKAGIDVYTPTTLKDGDAAEIVRSLHPDVICVAAYGCLLPQEILEAPLHGCLNVHTSLLPRWRGAAPIERAILAGDEETGVCIMKMEKGLDTGPFCICESVRVEGRYLAEMTALLASKGAKALSRALDDIQTGEVSWTPQVDEGLVYAEKIAKGELDFSPEDTVELIDAKVRAANDSHPSKICVAGKVLSVERVKTLKTDEFPGADQVTSGMVALIAKRLVIGASDGIVELEQVKPDGKKSMEGRAFASGLQGIKSQSITWGRA